MRKRLISATLLAAAMVLPASSAGATPPSDVMFEVPTVIPDDGGPTFGPFTATGPAVDAGLMCPSGETTDVFGKASGGTPQGINFQAVKLFECDDGSGAFVVKLQVRLDRKGDNFQWVVLDGFGAYEQLRGAGDGVGFPLPDGVFDVYQGEVHLD